jgi:hypothetical protein
MTKEKQNGKSVKIEGKETYMLYTECLETNGYKEDGPLGSGFLHTVYFKSFNGEPI